MHVRIQLKEIIATQRNQLEKFYTLEKQILYGMIQVPYTSHARACQEQFKLRCKHGPPSIMHVMFSLFGC